MDKLCTNHAGDLNISDYELTISSYCKYCKRNRYNAWGKKNRKKLTEKQRAYRLKQRDKKTKSRFNPNQKNLIDKKFGKLLVLYDKDKISYGGRLQVLWHCICECGNTIDLPTVKLTSAFRKNHQVPIYTSCEDCRCKKCIFCGEKFSFKKTSKICDSEKCKEELKSFHNSSTIKKRAHLYKTDKNYRNKKLSINRKYYAEHSDKIQDKRQENFEKLNDEGKHNFIIKIRESGKKSYRKIKLQKFFTETHLILDKMEKINNE